MDEHGFIRAIHRHLPPAVKVWKVCDSFNNEVADVWYTGTEGRHRFVEYKFVPKLPKRPDTLVKAHLTAKQRFWLNDMTDRGIPVLVVVGAPRVAVAYKQHEWQEDTGVPLHDFKSRGLRYAEFADHLTQELIDGRNTEFRPQANSQGQSDRTTT